MLLHFIFLLLIPVSNLYCCIDKFENMSAKANLNSQTARRLSKTFDGLGRRWSSSALLGPHFSRRLQWWGCEDINQTHWWRLGLVQNVPRVSKDPTLCFVTFSQDYLNLTQVLRKHMGIPPETVLPLRMHVGHDMFKCFLNAKPSLASPYMESLHVREKVIQDHYPNVLAFYLQGVLYVGKSGILNYEVPVSFFPCFPHHCCLHCILSEINQAIPQKIACLISELILLLPNSIPVSFDMPPLSI